MKAYFLTRQFREKLIVLALLAVGVALWGAHLYSGATQYRANGTRLAKERADQVAVLSKKAEIAAGQTEFVKQLDPKQSISDQSSFQLTIANLAKEVGIPEASLAWGRAPTPVRSAQLTIVTQPVTISGLDPGLGDAINFYRKVLDRYPYITVLETTLSLTGGNTRGGGAGGPGAGGPGAGGPGAPGGGGRGGRGGAATNALSTVGMVTGTEARGGGAGAGGVRGATARGPVGQRLSVTFTLTALSLTKPGATAPAPARAGAAAPAAPAATPNGA